MPPLANQQHERFAQAFAGGSTAITAYKSAGYKTNSNATASVNSSKLLKHTKIRSRIDELRAPVTQRTQITIESMTEMYLEDRRTAYRLEQISAAVRAADSIAKLYGLFIERHEHGGVGDFERMSDDALRNLARKALIIEGKVNKPEPENNDGS